MFYGPRSGGIRTYLNEKARVANASGLLGHHVIVPGRRELHEGGRHEVRSLRVMASNGCRIPLGVGALKDTLRRLRPDFVVTNELVGHFGLGGSCNSSPDGTRRG